MLRRIRRALAPWSVTGAVLLVSGCGSSATTPPEETADQTADDTGNDTPITVNLEGIWLVTPGPAMSYGAGRTTTLEFPASSSGIATFLSQADANGITTCESHVFASLDDKVILLDGVYYVAVEAAPDVIELVSGTDGLTLTKLSGAPPITPCGEAEAAQLAALDRGNANFTRLSAFETRLYFNVEDQGDPIIAYDVSTGLFGTPRVYSRSVSGGTHRWVVGARSDALFYGHCGCGSTTSVNAFNLDADTSIALVDAADDFGIDVRLDYGFFDGTSMVIGGQRRDQPPGSVNQLLTLDAETLALLSQRQILPFADVTDVAQLGGDLIALVGASIVFVGSDGRAERTVNIDGVATDSPNGLTTIGSTVYLLDEPDEFHSVLYEVELP